MLSEGWISLGEFVVVEWLLSQGALITAFDLVWLSRKQTEVGVKDVCTDAINPFSQVTSA